MGYFACRAAPLGPVGPGIVEATFFNFHPEMVRRAIPDAWSCATPAAVLEARSTSAAAALRRVVPDVEVLSAGAAPLLHRVIASASAGGRPLFAANRELVAGGTTVEDLWEAATALREHRGDGHVALLTAADIDGCEAHVLVAAIEGLDPELLRGNRGWSTAEWADAARRLADRGLLDRAGAPTDGGRGVRDELERRTDELAIAPFAALGDVELVHLLALLEDLAGPILRADEIPFPNPMGLPRADLRR
jgi:hypothetical protein